MGRLSRMLKPSQFLPQLMMPLPFCLRVHWQVLPQNKPQPSSLGMLLLVRCPLQLLLQATSPPSGEKKSSFRQPTVASRSYNGGTSNVIIADVAASNGVIHVIDKV